MQKEAARKLVQDTFEGAFEKGQFKKFVKELLNHLEDAPFTYRGDYIYKDFRDSVKTLERIGKYEDSDGKKIDVLIVNLIKTPSLERARSKQRNFVAKYLKGSRGNELKDGALVAFVSPDEQDWRFSFVKMEYKFDTTKKGQPKVTEQFTPARRYSFLVGENERSHTAQSRLLPILENTDHDPTLAEIEEAFSIEKVTKEFFENYRLLFHEIKDALDEFVKKDKATKADFQEKGVDTVDFAKKLIGQIVFLYFLQKKGWFGVGKRSEWGTGPKRFLRELFDKKHGGYRNFFNDILEPLFYNTLAVERPGDYSDKFDCRIPFLNGGLFDPLNEYDWQCTDILLSDKLFSNDEKTKQGDVGTGILDVFDRYNFTVKEDEPLEKEVAIDPEMLGKVFENLLEVKDRKSKGTYYTPREIVHYMCQESLINYLATELKDHVKRENIEMLIKHGEIALENDTLVSQQGVEKGRYKYKLHKSIREHNELIDRKLAKIKVCDPAVGSGAFLVGMMSEIVRTRSVLARLNNPDEEPNIYDFKRDAIQDSLHGVDIDLGAVEIAKLRLWLSLIVDEEDYKYIKPLPNLDYKIMQGNSLLEEYEGIKLIDERFFEKHEEKEQVQKRLKEQQGKWQREYFNLHNNNKLTPTKKSEIEKNLKSIEKQLKALEQPKPNGQDTFDIFGQTEAQSKAERLLELHEQFFNAHHKSEKDHLHEEIDKLTWDLISTTLKQEGKENKLEDVKRFQQTSTSPFFLWKLNFADVFCEQGGFDVVIANPPYGANLDEMTAIMARLYPRTTRAFKDIYKIFINLGMAKLLTAQGTLCYILPNTLLDQSRYRDVREFLLDYQILEIINLGLGVFEEVVVPTCVILVANGYDEDNAVKLADLSKNCVYSGVLTGLDYRTAGQSKLRNNHEFSFYESPQYSIDDNEECLEAIIDFKDAGINYQRVKVGLSEKGKSDLGQRLLYEGIKKSKEDQRYWKGVDIYAYWQRPTTNRLVHIATTRTLKPNERVILNSKYFAVVPKLLWRQTAPYIIATIDEKGVWFGRSIQAATIKLSRFREYDYKYLLGLLNSTYLRHRYSELVKEEGRVFPQVKLSKIKKLPIKRISVSEQKPFIDIVDRIISITASDTYDPHKPSIEQRDLEYRLNQMTYELFGLTSAEIAIVEGANSGLQR